MSGVVCNSVAVEFCHFDEDGKIDRLLVINLYADECQTIKTDSWEFETIDDLLSVLVAAKRSAALLFAEYPEK